MSDPVAKDRLKPLIGLLCHADFKNNQRVVVGNLQRLLGEIFDFVVLTGEGAEIPPELSTLTVQRVKPPRFDPYGWGYVLHAVHDLVAREKPAAVVCVSHPFPLGFALLLFRRVFRTPVVLRMTGDQFSERRIHANPLVRFRKYLMHELIMPRVLARADALLCVGDSIAEQLRKRGVPMEKVSVLPQPVDTRAYVRPPAERRAALRREMGIGEADRVALFCGSLTQGKGGDRLPRLLELTRDATPPLHFVVVGSGPLEESLRANGDARLHVLGRLSRDRTLEIFGIADVLIHPTRRDALPNVVLEAIGFGIPIISSPVGEIPRYVSHIETTDDGFADRLKCATLPAEPVPDWFGWSAQKVAYQRAFENFLRTPGR